jgi:hypothetical protein
MWNLQIPHLWLILFYIKSLQILDVSLWTKAFEREVALYFRGNQLKGTDNLSKWNALSLIVFIPLKLVLFLLVFWIIMLHYEVLNIKAVFGHKCVVTDFLINTFSLHL